MLNCIYDIFLTCDKNNCPDLVAMAQPMFLSDVQNNTREHVTDETDIGAWHEHAGELYAQSGEVGRFIGRHYDTLVEAFQARDAMVRLGLWKHFLFAFSSLQYGSKSRPDVYFAAARSLGSAPEHTIVFEDALHAARTAKEAGFLVAGVYDPSAEGDQEALREVCDWYLSRLDDPGFLELLK